MSNYWIDTIEGGQQIIYALYGPFTNINQALFADCHIPQNNLTSYQLSPVDGGGLIYRKHLSTQNLNHIGLPVEGPNTVELNLNPDGFLRAWDPYLRSWWMFKSKKKNNGKHDLRGCWKKFREVHHLRLGDSIEFVLAMAPPGPTAAFIVVRPIFASPGISHYRQPLQNFA